MANDNNTKSFGAQKYYPITMNTRGGPGQTDAQKDFDRARNPNPAGDGPSMDMFKNTVIGQPNAYVDAAAAYANNMEMVVSFYHVPSGQSVYFKAFITAFNETYSSDWGREAVFGRIDPIYLFKQTDRRISLALAVPSATDSEGYENLGKVQMLSQFLYPAYTDIESATSIAQSPLVKIKVMNLLQKTSGAPDPDASAWELINQYKSANEAESGQLGVINSLAINHNLERPDSGVIERGPNTVLPKNIELNLEFSPIHEHPLGWKNGVSQNQLFPYGVSLFSGGQSKDQQGNPIFGAAQPPGEDPDQTTPDSSHGFNDPVKPGDMDKPDQSGNSAVYDAAAAGALQAAQAAVRKQDKASGYDAATSFKKFKQQQAFDKADVWGENARHAATLDKAAAAIDAILQPKEEK